MRVAVVGHVEWVEFARVERVPAAGEIVHALETGRRRAGEAAVAASSSPSSPARRPFFTALGDDELGRRSREELEAHGVTVHAAVARRPQRRAFTHVDERGERTITTRRAKLRPRGHDDRCRGTSSPRWTPSLRQRRRRRIARGAPRARAHGHGRASSRRCGPARWSSTRSSGAGRTRPSATSRASSIPPPKLVVTTSGALGGWMQPGGPFRRLRSPGPGEDAYGCGDSFAAGLTYALAARRRDATTPSQLRRPLRGGGP